jgi:membrane-associated phospholipid phosphatase
VVIQGLGTFGAPPDFVKHVTATLLAALTALVLSASPGFSQTASATTPATSIDAPAPPSQGWATSFLRDVGGDYVHFISKENAGWLGLGGAAALVIHPADDDLSEWAQEQNVDLAGGATYGSQWLHIPVAIGVWAVGAAAGSGRVADAGRDLLRAQISAVSWTYAFKLATQRTRPNGDPHSFPSGHASTSFASAMVLQEHFGWKLGLPAFAAAAYTATSRVTANQHWASDVVFGAFVGMASGRTITIHLRDARLSMAPLAVPGGGGVLVTALRQP